MGILSESFERDRRALEDLCRAILERLKEPLEGGGFTDIEPLTEDIIVLELAERLGLEGAPICFFTRNEGIGVVRCAVIWRDPLGSGGGELPIYLWKPSGAISIDTIHDRGREKTRARLVLIMKRWLRAAKRAQMPPLFPAPSVWTPSDVDGYLGRDPLWRTLHQAVIEIKSDQKVRAGAWCWTAWPAWVSKLNKLAIHDGLTTDHLLMVKLVAGGKQVGLSIAEHDSSDRKILPIVENARLAQGELKTLETVLANWRDQRAELLSGGRPKSARKPAKIGRPVTYDLKADARLFGMMKTKRFTYATLADAEGTTAREVEAAVDRERKRRNKAR